MRTKTLISAAVILSLAALLAACGGGGGGGGTQPPTYNVTGVWSISETLGGPTKACGLGEINFYTYTIEANQQEGSNTVAMHDRRAPQEDTVNATMSANIITFNGYRYPEGTCTNMTASYTMTLSDASHFSGSGTVTCNDTTPGCSMSSTISGEKGFIK